MPLTPGSRLGSYEIVGPLGAGGMGEVYRARDTELDRDVALKILPESFANDADRLMRFEREAKTLAALNHPNIATIYGLASSPGQRALVMELVEGDDLSEKIRSGTGSREPGSGMPLDEVLPIAKQVAEALEAAHDAGIIHRDLKPANIKVRADGTVKVLDFGLAKAVEGAGRAGGAGGELATSPTMSAGATHAGVILGTAAYMSPEQAAGRAVDKRADIWAFGVVLFEMIGGRAPFAGETTAHLLAEVLKSDPPWHALPAETPVEVRGLIERCLAKHPRARLRDIGEARLLIETWLARPEKIRFADVTPRRLGPRSNPAFAGAVLAIGLATGAAATVLLTRSSPPTPSRPSVVHILPPDGHSIEGASLALSPDGTALAFAARDDRNRRSLWIRTLDNAMPRQLPGTDGADTPFWSPDGRALAFFSGLKLKRIDLAEGAVQVLADAPGAPLGGSWNRDDVILFSAGAQTSSIVRVSASGGPAERLSPTGRREAWPQFLPDGRRYIYAEISETLPGIHVRSLDGGSPRLLLRLDSIVARVGFASPGFLLFARGDNLMAQRLDPRTLDLSGDPFMLAERTVRRDNPIRPAAGFAVSGERALVYDQVSAVSTELTWYDRHGTRLGTLGPPGNYETVSLSPNGQQVVTTRFDDDRAAMGIDSNIWVFGVGRGVGSRLTTYPGPDFAPVWSPDGRRLLYAQWDLTTNSATLFEVPADGGPTRERVKASVGPTDWSPNGRSLATYQTPGSFAGRIVDVETGQLSPDQYGSGFGQFSPDGRWLAYMDPQSGRPEVVVRPVPGTGGRQGVSTSGGSQPRWRADGRELFFVGLDGTLMAMPVTPGPVLTFGTPAPLFLLPVAQNIVNPQYDVTADGQRFLVIASLNRAPRPVTLVLNWTR